LVNEKKRKMRFLEDYFSLCREHGFCVDYSWTEHPNQLPRLSLADWPSYLGISAWEDLKEELRESI